VTHIEALQSIGILVDSWCDQRKLKPLRFVLQSYPLVNPLTDGWADLLRSLEDVRAFCGEELSRDDDETVHSCIVALQGVVYR
jgi:hypothetical protein